MRMRSSPLWKNSSKAVPTNTSQTISRAGVMMMASMSRARSVTGTMSP